MTIKATPLRITRREAILQIAAQMEATEGKSYTLSHIANRIRREPGKWIMDSQRYRYEVTDYPDGADMDANSAQLRRKC